MAFWNRKKAEPILAREPGIDDVRIHYHFTGMVQGVGFRVEMWRRANSLNLSGWVKNNQDGSVEAEVQGNKEKIDNLILQMEHIPRIMIDEIRQEPVALQMHTPFEMLNY